MRPLTKALLVLGLMLGTMAVITQPSAATTPASNPCSASGHGVVATDKAADNDTCGAWTPIVPGQSVKALAKAAEQSYKAQSGGTDATLSIGWFTALLSLTHGDVISATTQWLKDGSGAAIGLLCYFLPPVVNFACAAAFALEIVYIGQLIWTAATQVTYTSAWWCLGQWTCPGTQFGPAFWWVWSWFVPVQQTGLNILFTWGGIPIAYQYTINP